MKTIATVMMVILLAATSGCSITLQDRPSKTIPNATCSNSRLYPTIDTAIGIAGMVAGGAALAYAWSKNHESYVLPSGATLFGGWVATASGFEGRRLASDCDQRSGVALR